jgi:hypothetical protein
LRWLSAEQDRTLGLLHIKTLLWAYYAERRKTDKKWLQKGFEMWDLSLKMLGPQDAPLLGAKAKETEGLLPCCVNLLAKYQRQFTREKRLRTDMLLAAGRADMDFT